MKSHLKAFLCLTAGLISIAVVYAQEDRVAAAPIDGTLFTTYSMDAARTIVSFSVCGSLPGSSGCYGGGTLTSFGRVGAILEGNPKTDLSMNTVTRALYILDVASGVNQNEVVLDVYTRVDTITTDFDTITVTLSQTISLPSLRGSTSAQGYMAANNAFLFAGTNRSMEGVEIDKRSFAVTETGSFFPPINVSGISADQYGYVTVSFGSPNGSSGFILFGPDGFAQEEGGGLEFTVNTIQAGLPSTLH
jgi:hypothetical protein